MASTRSNVPERDRSWKKWFHNIPVVAIGFLFLSLACIVACAITIAISDQQEVSSWRIQPTVLLAVFSSISNFFLTTALSTGIAITWWRSCIRGMSIECLYYIADKAAGRSFFPALFKGLVSCKVAILVSLVAIANFANNPLLQRATHVASTDIVRNDTLKLDISEQIPNGYTGVVQDASEYTSIGSRSGIAVAQGWFWNESIPASPEPDYVCDGLCEGRVRGAGLSYNCSSATQTLDMSTTANNGAIVFLINTTGTESSTGVPSVVLTILYLSSVNDSCIATLTTDICTIEAAVVEYPVIVKNSTVSLDQGKLDNLPVLSSYISAGDLLTAPPGAGAGPLEGLSDFIGGYLETNISETIIITQEGQNAPTYGGDGYFLFADMFFEADASSYESNNSFTHCGLQWRSPTSYVLNFMNEFMFRAALRVGSNNSETQVFPVTRTISALLFYSDYRFLGAALGVVLCALVALVVLLWGWWELEDAVSLSPIEIMSQFQAPILKDTHWNMTTDELIPVAGKIRIHWVQGKAILEVDLQESSEEAVELQESSEEAVDLQESSE